MNDTEQPKVATTETTELNDPKYRHRLNKEMRDNMWAVLMERADPFIKFGGALALVFICWLCSQLYGKADKLVETVAKVTVSVEKLDMRVAAIETQISKLSALETRVAAVESQQRFNDATTASIRGDLGDMRRSNSDIVQALAEIKGRMKTSEK